MRLIYAPTLQASAIVLRSDYGENHQRAQVMRWRVMTLGAAVALIAACTAPTPMEPVETLSGESGRTPVTVQADGWVVTAATSSPGQLRIDPDPAAPSTGWPDTGTGQARAPVSVESTAPLTGEATLQKELPEPLPQGVVSALAYLDTTRNEWIPVPTTISTDRRTLIAQVTHFSIWESVAATIGTLASVRVDQPTCENPASPAWVEDVIVVDSANSPLRWCSGRDPKDKSILVVKVAANRGYGFGIKTRVKPVWISTTSTSDSDVINRLTNWPVVTGYQVAQDVPGGLPLPPGQEIHFGFRLADVKDLEPDQPLIEAVGDVSFFMAGLVYTALEKAVGDQGNAWAKATFTALAVQHCLVSLGKSYANPVLGAPALLECLGDNADAIFTAVLLSAPNGIKTIAPDLIRAGMQKLHVLLAAGVMLSVGVVLGEYTGDATNPRQAFAAYLSLTPPPRSDPDLTVIAPGRLGPLRIGEPAQAAVRLSLVTTLRDGQCNVKWQATARLLGKSILPEYRYGTDADDLDFITAYGPAVHTEEGVGEGTSLRHLQDKYPGRLHRVVLEDEGGPYLAYVLFGREGALVFSMGATSGPTDRVQAMIATRGTSMGDLDEPFHGC